MRPPEFRGPGSGEPPEPWLIRHWNRIRQTVTGGKYSFGKCETMPLQGGKCLTENDGTKLQQINASETDRDILLY